MAKRIALSVYGPPSQHRRAWVSGLPVFQRRLTALLSERDVEVIPFHFVKGGPSDPANGVLSCPAPRRFYMSAEAGPHRLPWDSRLDAFRSEILHFLDREQVDALYIVEWSSVGMALWEAALSCGRPVAFTPTEHLAVCPYGFLLTPSGESCNGPGNGARCSRCTHSLEPYPAPSLTRPWFSRRHKLFHRVARWAPPALRPLAIRTMAAHLQGAGVALSEAEGRARLASARRFLTSEVLVAYQSPHQHRVFERALGERLPLRLPPLLPLPPLGTPDGKRVDQSSRPVAFLFAARPDFDRGLWQLLDAWERWAPASAKASLDIRTHALPPELSERIARLRAADRNVSVHLGRLDPDALREVHRGTHYVVNPAAWEEPGSATVYEGMFLGTPSIVPSASGSADFVAHGVNGWTYAFRDAEGLASALEEACERMDQWKDLHDGALAASVRYVESSRRHVDQLMAGLFPGKPCFMA